MQYTDNEAALIGGLISTYFFQPAACGQQHTTNWTITSMS